MLADALYIGIWGFGREGRATYDFIRSLRPDVAITVLGDGVEPPAGLPDDVDYLGGESGTSAIANGVFDVVVKSPGISIIRPEIAAAKTTGTQFTSGTNLWFEHRRRGLVIGITGTKGKSTVATLATQLIANSGRDVRLLGNTGTPALSQQGGDDATVLELSSYQLADFTHAPDLAAINNLFPEHVPWHGSLERYYSDKLRIATINPAIPVIANFASDELRSRLDGRQNVHWCNTASGYRAEAGKLLFGDQQVTILGPMPGGDHNLSNLAVAASVVNQAGFLSDPLTLDLTGYVELPHRQQTYMSQSGVRCVDDSISTVPEATAAALARFGKEPVHLILGGSDRGQDYSQLIGMLAGYPIAGIFLLPQTGHALIEPLREALPDTPMAACEDLENAMQEIGLIAKKGDSVILSPGAPSFIQFSNFEERGRRFVQLSTEIWGDLTPSGNS